MKQILRDREKPPALTKKVDIELPEENCWDKLPNEPVESQAILLDLINNVKKKTISGLFNYLHTEGKTNLNLTDLKDMADQYKWIERAWAYDRSQSLIVKERQESAMELVQSEMEKFALHLAIKTNQLIEVTDPMVVATDYAGIIGAAKASLPTQVAAVYKALVGDKAKLTVEGKFDHRMAVAVAEFAKDT